MNAGKTRDPLDVSPFSEFEGNEMGFFSKGHHEDGLFLEAVRGYGPIKRSLGPVQRYWVRCVPVGNGHRGTVWSDANPATRGAFPVTVVEYA